MIPVSVLQRFHRFLEVGDDDELKTKGVVQRPTYLQNIGQKLKTWAEYAYFPVIERKMAKGKEERNLKKLVSMCDQVANIFSEYDTRSRFETTQDELTTSCKLVAPGWESKPTLLVALFNEYIHGNNTNAHDIDQRMFSDANVVLFTLTRGCGVAFAISESRSDSKKVRVTLRFDIFCDITPRELSYYDKPPKDIFLNSALIEYFLETNSNSSWEQLTDNYCMMLQLFQSAERIENALLEFSGDGTHTDHPDYWKHMLELYYRIPEITTDMRDLGRESQIKGTQDIYKPIQINRKFVFKVYLKGKHRFIWIFEEINSSPAQPNVTPSRRYLIINEPPDTIDYPRPETPDSNDDDEDDDEDI